MTISEMRNLNLNKFCAPKSFAIGPIAKDPEKSVFQLLRKPPRIDSQQWPVLSERRVVPISFYTGSDSKIGNRQGGGHKGNAKPTQHKPFFESRAVHSYCFSKMLDEARIIEKAFNFCKFLPQYRFITRPIYKVVVSKTNPVFATAITFLAADLIIHQFLASLSSCAYKQLVWDDEPCDFSWSSYSTAAWLMLALPVMLAKYQRMISVKLPRRVLPQQSLNKNVQRRC